jgi:hypothetical protein
MSLAQSNEPLRLADGSLVYPGGRVVGAGSATAQGVSGHAGIRARRKVSDLPDAPRITNAIAVVMGYVLYGLEDEGIAEVTGLSVDQVVRIKTSDSYSQMYDTVVRSVMDAETDVVREFIAKNARHAATVMVDALEAGNRGDRMAAARDILDRSGHRPADVVEHRHSIDGGLVIEYVKRSEVNIPTIDMESV